NPSSFTLAPGATQIVTITGTPQAASSYEGASLPFGSGVPTHLQIPVKLLSVAAPTGPVVVQIPAPRVDVAALTGASPSGSVQFKNTGTATLTGILTSDVPWI